MTFALTALVLASGACAAAGPNAGAGIPAPIAEAVDSAALADSLRRSTSVSGPRRVTFGWSLDEAGAGFRGQGVARFVAPSRFRLDLFGPRGESYFSAALVDGHLRVPAAVTARFSLPSPSLLWAAAGIFHPPADARLAEGRHVDGGVLLRYEVAGGILEFRSRGTRLVSARRLRAGGVQESVELQYRADGTLRTAQYRDWGAYRTLTLTLEPFTPSEPFADDIWNPTGA